MEFWPEITGIIHIESNHCGDSKFRWIFPNFFANSYKKSDNEKASCVICSPYFEHFGEYWHLVLILNGYHNENIGFFLWKNPRSQKLSYYFKSYLPNELKFTVKLSLTNYDPFDEYVDSCNSSTGCFGNWNFLHVSKLIEGKSELSPAGFLEFVFEFKIGEKLEARTNQAIYPTSSIINSVEIHNEDEEESEDEINTDDEKKGVERLVQNLKSLFLNGLKSDLVLRVQEREFKVHRSILVVRSPVFASMLEHDMKENITGVVDVPDCTPEAFEGMLSYVYTASSDHVCSDNVFDLYYAADKYQINDLKAECVEFMEKNLSIKTFCAVMTLSLQHCESALQKKATQFFCENFKTVIKSPQWIKYATDYPVQANELIIKACNA